MWGYVDLNDESKKTQLDLDDPAVCLAWVDALHRSKGIDYSFGGFLEDRSHLLRNQYNGKTNAFIHLGVDFWVPEGTRIGAVERSRICHILRDQDQDGGWGGRVMARSLYAPRYMIYGHLRHDIPVREGQVCDEGDLVGVLGGARENGNWAPHLHLQCLDERFVMQYADLGGIDGYLQKGHPLIGDVLDPMPFVRV